VVTYCFGFQAKNRSVTGVPDLSGPKGYIEEAARIGANTVQIFVWDFERGKKAGGSGFGGTVGDWAGSDGEFAEGR
jgi:hypothetical protein